MRRIPKIVIVDDNESVREATKGLVRSLGYSAVTFASAEDYLSSGHVNDTACLITDVQMPGLGGIELQSLLATEGRQMPVIFITAYPAERVQRRAERAGACGFFAKPFEEEKFHRVPQLCAWRQRPRTGVTHLIRRCGFVTLAGTGALEVPVLPTIDAGGVVDGTQ